MTSRHPRLNRKGNPVEIQVPNQPTELSAWQEASALATVTPGGTMPDQIHGVSVRSWQDAPDSTEGWLKLAEGWQFDEPPFEPRAGMRSASGAVIVESDRRVWVVSPTNQFWGYVNTFPKGTCDSIERAALHANALKEVFEESGLRVELTGFLADSIRTESVTRYYLARRLGGNPTEMGWESQAVHLVPMTELASFLNQDVDRALVQRLHVLLTPG